MAKTFRKLRDETFVRLENKENSIIKNMWYHRSLQDNLNTLKEQCRILAEGDVDDFSNLSHIHEVLSSGNQLACDPEIIYRVKVENPKLNGGYLEVTIHPIGFSKFTKIYFILYGISTSKDITLINGSFEYTPTDNDGELTPDNYKLVYRMVKEVILNFLD